MPGRKFVSGEEYRFGFNGVEQEDEIAEGVNFTYFRMQDSRLGRWWSHDPKPNVSVSPYAMMENNPVMFSDVLGDTITGDVGAVTKLEKKANERVGALKARIEDLKTKINSPTIRNGERKRLRKQLSQAESALAGTTDFLEELETLRSSSVNYHVDIGGGNTTDLEAGGVTEPYGTGGAIRVAVFGKMDQFNENQQLGRLAHELKHAYQYETGKLSFILRKNHQAKGLGTYDLEDEMEAYQRQEDLGLTTRFLPGRLTKKKVAAQYPQYPEEQITLDSQYGGRTIRENIMHINHHAGLADRRKVEKGKAKLGPIIMYNGAGEAYQKGYNKQPLK